MTKTKVAPFIWDTV